MSRRFGMIASCAITSDKNPNHLTREERTVTDQDIIELPLAADGGAVIRIIH